MTVSRRRRYSQRLVALCDVSRSWMLLRGSTCLLIHRISSKLKGAKNLALLSRASTRSRAWKAGSWASIRAWRSVVSSMSFARTWQKHIGQTRNDKNSSGHISLLSSLFLSDKILARNARDKEVHHIECLRARCEAADNEEKPARTLSVHFL